MMLDHLGETEAAAAVMAGIETVMAAPDGPKTADIGGSANTVEVGSALAAAVAGERSSWRIGRLCSWV